MGALGAASQVFAEPAASTPVAPRARPSRPHAVYLDLLGKTGLWGLGYDFSLSKPWAVGSSASVTLDHGQRVFAVSPYLTYYPVGERHRWLIQAGPTVQRIVSSSPVPEWKGLGSTHLGGEVSTGYEYRGPVLFRAYTLMSFGSGGWVPWLGFSIGHAF